MEDLQRLLAYEQIRQLASRYALAIDSRDLDALVALFVDDVRVGRDERGREALRRNFDRQLREIGISILFVGNHVIDLEDDGRARGVVYCKAEIQHRERWIQQAIQYRDTYERREDRHPYTRALLDSIPSLDPAARDRLRTLPGEVPSPLHLPPANWPEHHTGKGTLPESWESWTRFWQA